DLLAAALGGQQRRLVDQVGQVGAGHAGGGPGDPVEADALVQRHAAGVDGEDRGAPGRVGQPDLDGPVEPAGAQQRLVEDLRPVGGADDDDTLRAGEAVHLGEDLVEGLLALVVAADAAGAAAGAADGVDLVDEDDGRRDLARLLEQVSYAGGADADDHLDELGGAGREERHLGLTGDGPGEQGLAGAGRPGQQHALGQL